MELPPGLPIPHEDWDRTPISVQMVIITQIAILREQVARLEGEVERLREQINKNSRNSSKPPSSDGPQTPPKTPGEPSGRKPGGQKGHHGHGRKLKPPEQVQRLVICKPDRCSEYKALLLGEDLRPQRRQVSELPKIEPEITEYQLHTHLDLPGVWCEDQWAMAERYACRQFWATDAGDGWLSGRTIWHE